MTVEFANGPAQNDILSVEARIPVESEFMTIQVACPCGASFAAKDELAGRSVRCPKCQQPLKIPARAAAAPVAAAKTALDDLFDEEGIGSGGGPRCPKCGQGLKPNAAFCTKCGLDLRTGQQREGVVVKDKSRGGHGEAADDLLVRAERQIAVDKEEDRKNRSSGQPAYVYIFGLIALAAFATMMFTMPKGLAFQYTGIGILIFGLLINTYYGIRIIIAAFMESVAQGFLQFVPFYSIYYLITRWQRVGKFFMKQLSTIGLILIGLLFMWIGSLIPPPDSQAAMPDPAVQVSGRS